MDHLFARFYAGEPFILFSLSHFFALGVVLFINVALLGFGRNIPSRWRAPLRYALAVLLLLNESIWHVWNLAIDQWTVQTMLPLHLCSILVFVSAIMLFNNNYSLFELVYFWGIAGAIQALLTPDIGIYGFPHYRFFQVFISHGAIVTAGVYMAAAEGFRPSFKSLTRVFVIGNAYALMVGLVNAFVGSNYLFVAHKPETASLLDVLPAWPWYILFMELIAAFFFLLLYLPFARQNRKTRLAEQGQAA